MSKPVFTGIAPRVGPNKKPKSVIFELPCVTAKVEKNSGRFDQAMVKPARTLAKIPCGEADFIAEPRVGYR